MKENNNTPKIIDQFFFDEISDDLKEFFEIGVVSVKKTKCTKILSKLK